MRKVKRTIRRCSLILLCLLLTATVAVAGADGGERELLALRIEHADWATLVEMARARGLEGGTAEEIRSSLLAYHQIDIDRLEVAPSKDRSIAVTILDASSIESPSPSLFIIEGGVKITITADRDGKTRTVEADHIIIDIDNNRLTAHGSVRYDDQGETGRVEAEILSYAWEEGDLDIVNALMASEHEKKDSDDGTKQLILYSRAASVSSIAMGSMTTYRHGIIATRIDDPLSSIRAREMLFRPGGDLLAKGATLQVGRVPLLWLPFFPFINNRMVGNPAIGFNSDRGMFVSTTWELFGSYPKIQEAEQSEAVALLARKEEGTYHPGTIIYSREEEPTPLEAWAEESGSYLALTADAYERSGISVGFDGSLSLLDKRLKINGLGLLALDPDGVEVLNTPSAVSPLRYVAEPTIAYDSPYARVRLELPLYSDPSVKSLYANRLTTFTIEGPLGKALEFPTDYKGDITTTVWLLNASLTLPTTRTKPYLSSLTIPTLNAQVKRQYKKDAVTKLYDWQYTSIVVPDVTIKATGTPLSLKRSLPASSSPTASAATSSSREVTNDPLLVPFYKTPLAKAKSKTAATQELSLSYSIEQRLNRRLDPESGEQEYFYSFSKANVRLFATPHSKLLTITEELVPQLSLVEDQHKKVFYNQEGQVFLTSRLAIPLIGLEYQLSHRLARTQVTEDANGRETIEEGWAFTKEQVTVHRITLAKSFSFLGGTAKPSLTMVLPPLQQSITPLISWGIGSLTLTSSAKFVEKEGVMKSDRVGSSLQYKDRLFTFTIDGTYLLNTEADNWWERLSIKQAFSYQSPSAFWKLGQSVSYEGLSKEGVAHSIEALTLKAEIPHLLLQFTAHGPIDGLRSKELKGSVSLLDRQLRFYKRRITFSWGINTSLYFHFEDPYASKLEFEAKAGLSIAEFLDVKLSVKSVNTGFYRYYTDDAFVFGTLWEDLLRSFDFVGSGRQNTQFNLNAISLELVHDLGDWSLNCKYNASVVLSNNQYHWVPTVTVFLSWKVLNELDIDERWTQKSDVWVRSNTT